MKEYMKRPGDMSPDVEDYQAPMKDFSQEQYGKTLNYIERQDKHKGKAASMVRKQSYEGRYT